MKKISDRFRKSLRTVFRVIGVSSLSLIIQACYGPPPSRGSIAYGTDYQPRTNIRGKVKANKTDNPILGIKVSVEEAGSYAYTDKNGIFNLTVPVQEEYILKIKDTDGPDNGGSFKEETQILNKDDTHTDLLAGMDIDN